MYSVSSSRVNFTPIPANAFLDFSGRLKDKFPQEASLSKGFSEDSCETVGQGPSAFEDVELLNPEICLRRRMKEIVQVCLFESQYLSKR